MLSDRTARCKEVIVLRSYTLFCSIIIGTSMHSAVIAGPSIAGCDKLATFPMSQYASNISKSVVDAFGAPLSEWSDEDLKIFADTMISCKAADANFQRGFSPRWFMDRGIGPVKVMVDEFKKLRAEQSAQISYDKNSAALLAEAKPLIEKAQNLSATAAEITRLEQIRAESLRIPTGNYPGAVKQGAGQQLFKDADASIQQYKAGIEGRANAARAAEQQAAAAKSEAQAAPLRMLITYAIVDYCAEQKAGITRAQADELQKAIKSELDAESVPQDLRDKYWNAGQSGLQMSGIAQQPRYRLEKDCNELRTTLSFSNAPGFGVASQPARKNPF